jgi:hypothetical protein
VEHIFTNRSGCKWVVTVEENGFFMCRIRVLGRRRGRTGRGHATAYGGRVKGGERRKARGRRVGSISTAPAGGGEERVFVGSNGGSFSWDGGRRGIATKSSGAGKVENVAADAALEGGTSLAIARPLLMASEGFSLD